MTSEIYASARRQTFFFSAVFNVNPFSNESMISVMTSLVIAARTRTKDKYRIVYSDHQRLELEKEFHYSRYITIRRKAELANMIGLSERQVGSEKKHFPHWFSQLILLYILRSKFGSKTGGQRSADLWRRVTIPPWRTSWTPVWALWAPSLPPWWGSSPPAPSACPLVPTACPSITFIRCPGAFLPSWNSSDSDKALMLMFICS